MGGKEETGYKYLMLLDIDTLMEKYMRENFNVNNVHRLRLFLESK